MENQKNDLPSEGTKKELYDRLKTTMQEEAKETAKGSSRRGFLNAIVTGVATLSALGVAGQAVALLECGNPSWVLCGTCQNECQSCQSSCIQNCQTACIIGCEGCVDCQTGI